MTKRSQDVSNSSNLSRERRLEVVAGVGVETADRAVSPENALAADIRGENQAAFGLDKVDQAPQKVEAQPVQLAMATELALPSAGGVIVQSDAIVAADAEQAADGAAGTTAEPEDRNLAPFIVGGVLLAGGVIAAVASGGGNNVVAPPANTAPTFTSGTTATIAENAAITTVVYDANATDAQNNTITFSLGGADAALFAIDGATGVVTLRAPANFETRTSFAISVVATDNGSPAASTTQAVAVTVTNVNEAPVFTSGATATVAENAATSTVVYTAAATDPDAGTTLTYSLSGADAALFAINSTTGVVTLLAPANFENRSSFAINVVATDNANPALQTAQAVAVSVTNVNEAPTFALATQTVAINENVAISTTVLTAAATDPDAGTTLTYSLTGADASAFAINAATGVVTFVTSPDFETRSSFVFNVVARDNANPALSASSAVTVNINDLLEGIRIDGGAIPATSVTNFSAATGNIQFLESAAAGNQTVIAGFAPGDTITTDAATGIYSFSSNNTDLTISLNNGGVVTQITLQNAVSAGSFIFSEATAEAAVGSNFFLSSSTAPPPVLPPPVASSTVTIDAVGASASFSAATESVTYRESATAPNSTTITGFGPDDRIVVSGANGGLYSFTSIDNDLIITFNNAGVASQITLADVVSPNAFIFDEMSAIAALGGGDFFTYA